MNVLTPKLLPQEYARANYLKTEIQNARNYIKLNPDGDGTAALRRFFADVAELEDLQVPVE